MLLGSSLHFSFLGCVECSCMQCSEFWGPLQVQCGSLSVLCCSGPEYRGSPRIAWLCLQQSLKVSRAAPCGAEGIMWSQRLNYGQPHWSSLCYAPSLQTYLGTLRLVYIFPKYCLSALGLTFNFLCNQHCGRKSINQTPCLQLLVPFTSFSKMRHFAFGAVCTHQIGWSVRSGEGLGVTIKCLAVCSLFSLRFAFCFWSCLKCSVVFDLVG